MDSNVSSTKKGLKLFDGQTSNGLGDDRITSLPHSIIYHILSFLPTTQVGRTCVLSSRWRFHWRSTPALYLSDGFGRALWHHEDKQKNFMDFVDRVFTLRDDASNIDKFRLQCYNDLHGSSLEPRVNTWMSMLARHKLVELILDIKCKYDITFPHLLDHFESLSVLVVRMDCIVPVPDFVSFSSPKLLHLQSVAFASDKLSRQISFHFPLLQEFVLESCDWLEIQTININAPSLTKLILEDNNSLTVLSGTEIKIHARSLISLSIPTTMVYEYFLCDLPSLVNASIRVNRGPFDVVCGSQRLEKCITSINNVKNLEINIMTIEALSSAGILTQMQAFPNLINMTVTNYGNGFSGSHLIKLLSCMPNVESLFIDVDDRMMMKHTVVGLKKWFLRVFCQNLKSVEIRHLNGSEKELCLITYLLPRTLKKMTIHLSFRLWGRPKKQNDILKRLLMIPRGSSGTRVKIISS